MAPSIGPALRDAHMPMMSPTVDKRTLYLSGLGIGLGMAAALIAQLLTRSIYFVTNLAFFHRISLQPAAPHEAHLGWWIIFLPAIGGIIVGLMARYGSKAIRGHGIPEAMEQVLTNESRIPPRITFLKPLSAAIAIGTGGPFGAEGPIIATGGALGSLIGQLLPVSASERKTLLAAGAAAGMAATFGSPVSAVLLAVELLLFEFRPRSFIPVALAASAATAMRFALVGTAPAFVIPELANVPGPAVAGYLVEGLIFGVIAAVVTRAVYAIEDGFEKLPIHWMWWPALGGLVVGACGLIAPRTLGVGYDNIENLLAGSWTPSFIAMLCLFKFISWSISLGSGTSGGTLAPLFTIGGALGALFGAAVALVLPKLGVEPRVAALVGMAAIFAGASRALLASVVFAFETTRQPMGLLPLLAGCTAAFMVTSMIQRHSIMTEKIARRGVRVIGEYAADVLARMNAKAVATSNVLTLKAGDTVLQAREWLGTHSAHQAFPVVDEHNHVVGVLTRRDLAKELPDTSVTLKSIIVRQPVVVFDNESLRDAADRMAREKVGRLPVLSGATGKLVGIVTRSDLVHARGMHADAG
ncbi:MAG: chloride channel protein [Myxococcaceae bacterium]